MSGRCERLAGVVSRFGDPDDPVGRWARERAVADGLSPQMADWALRTTCARYTPEALAALPHRPERVAVLLAASVVTAPIRAVVAPLAGGAEVVVRPSRRQADLAVRLVSELAAEGLPVALGPADRAAFLQAASSADRVVAHGSDEAVAAIGGALAGGTVFEGRGHGFGLCWVAADAAEDGAAAGAVALDVAAYDQHGCLSPQVVLVEGGPAERFARLLHRALADIEGRLARGRVDGARIVQWQGVTAATATAFWRGPTHAVAAVTPGAVPGSPGGRNVAVVGVRDVGHAAELLGGRLRFVTTVGVAGAADLAGVFGPARLVAAGTVQDPPLDGPEDPRPPLAR